MDSSSSNSTRVEIDWIGLYEVVATGRLLEEPRKTLHRATLCSVGDLGLVSVGIVLAPESRTGWSAYDVAKRDLNVRYLETKKRRRWRSHNSYLVSLKSV